MTPVLPAQFDALERPPIGVAAKRSNRVSPAQLDAQAKGDFERRSILADEAEAAGRDHAARA